MKSLRSACEVMPRQHSTAGMMRRARREVPAGNSLRWDSPQREFAVKCSEPGTVTLSWDNSAVKSLVSDVTIELYDGAGYHEVTFDATHLGSGL